MKPSFRQLAIIQLAIAGFAAHGGGAWAAGAVVEAPDKSIAYWTTHKASQDIAAQIALGNCGQRFGHCWLKTTFEHGCLAVAVAPGSHWSWAVRQSPEEAQGVAMSKCAADGDACTLKASSCE